MTGRQPFPDELRGVALLGIVVVNAPFLVISGDGLITDVAAPWWDRVAEGLVAALAQGKSYLLFALLFGYGAALMLRLDRGPATRGPIARYRRRLLGLGVLGALHATLLFVGDILVPYALIGLLVPWLARRSDRGLVRVALAGWALTSVVLLALVLAYAADPVPDELVAAGAGFDRAMAGSSVGAMVEARLAAYPDVALTLAVLNAPLVLACFALGLLAGRKRLLADPAVWTSGRPARAVSRVALVVGLPCGIVAGLLQAGALGGSDTADLAGVALGFVTAPLLSAGYVVWLARASVAGRLAWAARAGRQSLSCYIGESLVLVAVASGWGLGLFGDVGGAVVLAIAIATYVALELLAGAWAARFRQGPLEWGLRWWTHARRPPLRRTTLSRDAA